MGEPCASYYKYEPQVVLENGEYKHYWDRTVYLSRPDITLVDKTHMEAAFVNIENPSTLNLQTTITEEHRKYHDLVFKIVQQWQLKNITVIPFVFSATKVIPNVLN